MVDGVEKARDSTVTEIGGGEDRLPGPLVGNEFLGSQDGRSGRGAEELTVDDGSRDGGGGGRAETADDASAAEAGTVESDSGVGLVELVGETTMKIADELGTR